MKIGGILAFALGETLSRVDLCCGGVGRKTRRVLSWFAATPRFFLSVCVIAYRDLCRGWQLVRPSVIDDVCCVRASVRPTFGMQLHRRTFESNLTFCWRFSYTSTYFVQNAACFWMSGPGRNAGLQFLREALWYSGTSGSKTARPQKFTPVYGNHLKCMHCWIKIRQMSEMHGV